MKMNYKHLGLYVLVGIVSGGLCTWMWSGGVSSHEVKFYLMAITLAIAILVAGRYISDIQFRPLQINRSEWLSPAIIIVACGVGWHFAYELGYAFSQFGYEIQTASLAYIGSGAIGGICVSIGIAVAWNLSRARFAMTVITMAGVLGVFGMLVFPLFIIIWQGFLLLGIGIAVQIDSAKSSAEQ